MSWPYRFFRYRVQLGSGDVAISEARFGVAFTLSPSSTPVPSTQTAQFTDPGPRGDRLDAREVTPDLKVHGVSFQSRAERSNC